MHVCEYVCLREREGERGGEEERNYLTKYDQLKAGDGAGTIVVAGEENTQPFESIENEAATGKNTTDNPAQTKPVLGALCVNVCTCV